MRLHIYPFSCRSIFKHLLLCKFQPYMFKNLGPFFARRSEGRGRSRPSWIPHVDATCLFSASSALSTISVAASFPSALVNPVLSTVSM